MTTDYLARTLALIALTHVNEGWVKTVMGSAAAFYFVLAVVEALK